MPDLYHVTTRSSVEDIFADGLRQDAMLRAKQKAPGFEPGDARDPTVPDPPEAVADRRAEEMIRAARSQADIPRDWPSHERSVFFWPDRTKAQSVADDGYGADPIVAVDSDALSPGATCLIAPTDTLDMVFERAFQSATDRNHLSMDEEDELVGRLVEWWAEVSVYEGDNLYGHEVWCGSDIPPEAIAWIHDPENDRRLYEPPDDPEQQRFIDLF